MKLNIFPTLIFFFLILPTLASENNWKHAKEGNKIILIRHALAPGNGDPKNFNIKDCSTQRNLNQKGIIQSKNLGKLFIENKIRVDKVLSSEWCRCKDTAFHAFGEFQIFKGLNSTFTPPFDKNEKNQIRQIKKYIQNWRSNNNNLVFVTHYSIITALTNAVPSSGEIVIIDKKLEVLATIETN